MRVTVETNRFSSETLALVFVAIVVVCIVGAIIIWFVWYADTMRDEKLPVVSKRVKIRERVNRRMVSAGECFLVESDTGERLELRNLKSNGITIMVGDVGIIQYMGSTICSFCPETTLVGTSGETDAES